MKKFLNIIATIILFICYVDYRICMLPFLNTSIHSFKNWSQKFHPTETRIVISMNIFLITLFFTNLFISILSILFITFVEIIYHVWKNKRTNKQKTSIN